MTDRNLESTEASLWLTSDGEKSLSTDTQKLSLGTVINLTRYDLLA